MDKVWIIREESYRRMGDVYAVYRTYKDALYDFHARCEELCAIIDGSPWNCMEENSKFAITTGGWYIILEPAQFV